MQIRTLNTADEIAQSFDAFLELRPALSNVQKFVSQVLVQQQEGYEIVAIEDNSEIIACAGFRIMTMLAWGKILYIDDLISKEKHRGKGHGKLLLEHVIRIAKDNRCNQVHLDSGHARHAAHRLYLNHGFKLSCHHLELLLE